MKSLLLSELMAEFVRPPRKPRPDGEGGSGSSEGRPEQGPPSEGGGGGGKPRPGSSPPKDS